MESTRILVDTSILIEYLRKTKKDRTILYRYSGISTFVISVVTEFEFWIGVNEKSRLFTENLLSQIHILPFDSSCVESALVIQQQLKRINKQLPLQDLFIAATAITHNIPLLTLNSKHFVAIQDIILVPVTE